MKQITWDNNSYKIDGQDVYLVSGEFHYFRVPKKDWETRLKLFKEAGGNCIATYIPWILHEPSEGDIRFGDIPERDFEGFINLCKKLNIYVICRPGPYQYSEIKYAGLPEWLCKGYPEILASNVSGHPLGDSVVSYLHPVFLEKTRTWFERICPIIAKHTLSQGGPVAFVQFDNELIGIHEWSGGWDYNSETMGFGKEEGRFANFLKQRYVNIENITRAYGTDYTSFAEVYPRKDKKLTTDMDRLREKDYQDFYFSTVAEYSVLLVSWFREFHIDCGIVHNSPNYNMNSYFLETVERLGSDFILGSDHYYNLGPDWPQNNPTPQHAERIFVSNEMLRLMGAPATIFELPGGSCSDWPPITGEDLTCCYMTNIALGMKGLNYYIFTGGPNPENIGSNGDSYDYGASIGAQGDIRPHYYVQKKFGEFLSENSWMAASEREYDINVGLNWELSRSYKYSGPGSQEGFNNDDAWNFMHKGLVTTALCASYSPILIDLYKDSYVEHTDKPLLIATSHCMAKGIQERLVEYVKMGGKLLIAPVIPYMDENYNECTILKDFLEGADIEMCNVPYKRVSMGNIKNINTKDVWTSKNRPQDAIIIAIEENSSKEVSWKKDYPGGGSVIWLGINWNYDKNEQLSMIDFILKKMGCEKQVVTCNNPNIWTSLRTVGKQSMLFVMNLFSSPMSGEIKVLSKDGSYMDTGMHKLAPMEVKTIKLSL